MKKLFLFSLAALTLSGCAIVNVSEEGDKTMVDIENSGWYLLSFIPLASGDPKFPNAFMCEWFSDTVNLQNNMNLLDYAVRKRGANGIKDIVSFTTDEHVFFILFKRHAFHTSAQLLTEDNPE